MHFDFITIGTKMPSWVQNGYEEYAKRLTKFCKFSLIEIPLAKRTKNTNLHQAKAVESQLILGKTTSQQYLIAFDQHGMSLTTPQWADYLMNLSLKTSHVALIVGGPDGLDESLIQRAHAKISLSQLTLPHPLVRILVVEQLYRAFTILENHPYHK